MPSSTAYSRTYPRDLYQPWLYELIDGRGEPVEVRGKPTREILNAISEVTEPWHHCILIPSRRWNPFLALSEALWILAGRDDVASIQPYNSHITDYSDDGIHLYGAYGKRIFNQIDPLIERLRKDPNDRRAVLQIWDKEDLTANTKDPCCNQQIFFKLRNNKLNMTVTNRSNDIHFGLFAVNLPTFGILQSYIAARLGVEIGTQTHLSNSLHVYTEEPRAKAITERMYYGKEEASVFYPEHELVFTDLTHIKSHDEFAEMCEAALLNDVVDPSSYPPFLQFAARVLGRYRRRDWHHEDIPYHYSHQDWMLAADDFIRQVWK